MRAAEPARWQMETFRESVIGIHSVLQIAMDELSAYESDTLPNPSLQAPPSPSGITQAIDRAMRVLERFPFVARQLQNRHGDSGVSEKRQRHEINDEYDAQDLLHALLRIDFDDIRPEEHTPSSGGSTARMDFLLKDETIVIETKKTRQGLAFVQIIFQVFAKLSLWA